MNNLHYLTRNCHYLDTIFLVVLSHRTSNLNNTKSFIFVHFLLMPTILRKNNKRILTLRKLEGNSLNS